MEVPGEKQGTLMVDGKGFYDGGAKIQNDQEGLLYHFIVI